MLGEPTHDKDHHATDAFRHASIAHGIDYRALRERISIGQVLDVIGWTPTSGSGQQLRGPCPVHKSTRECSRTFAVDIERNLWYCHKCEKGGNQLDLYTTATGLPLYPAILELCDKLGTQLPWLGG